MIHRVNQCSSYRLFFFFSKLIFSAIFAFRSIGAYSRVQIRSLGSGLWLCLNRRGRIIQKVLNPHTEKYRSFSRNFQPNVSVDNLACTFRQSSDGVFINLISELDPSRKVTFDTYFLLSMNPYLRRRYSSLMTSTVNAPAKKELCQRFIFDSDDIDQTND